MFFPPLLPPGLHIVLPGYYSPRTMGLLDPATSDGRVIFFLPWESTETADLRFLYIDRVWLYCYSNLSVDSPLCMTAPCVCISLSSHSLLPSPPPPPPPPLTDRTIAGTTDSPTELTHLPMPREEDIKFILSEIKAYLSPNISGIYMSHPRQLIILRKSDGLGCAVLLCLVCCLTLLACFFLPSLISH